MKAILILIPLVLATGCGTPFYIDSWEPESSPDSTTSTPGTPSTPAVLTIIPTAVAVAVNDTFDFSASGGTPPYIYAIILLDGGSITPFGHYTAPTLTTSEVVRVTDAALDTADATVNVVPP